MPGSVFTRVLVGWDASAGATAGLQLGCRLTAVPGGRVIALAVVPSFSHVEDVTARERAAQDVRNPLIADYESAISDVELCPDQRVDLEFVEESDAARALDRYVAAHPIGLVIVGLHGREGLLHPKMGHIASRAIRTSGCPVLVVPEPGRPPSHRGHGESSRPKVFGLIRPFGHRD